MARELRRALRSGTVAALIGLVVGTGGETAMAFTLSSASFSAGGEIPPQHTCTGANQSPVLSWRDAPPRTKCFALIVDDPDAPAGDWVHWVLYDLPADASQLPQAVPASETPASGGKQGLNDFQKIGYGGPCPPPGKPHRYFFKLYALDAPLNLQPRAGKSEVVRAMEGHVLGHTELVGTYKR